MKRRVGVLLVLGATGVATASAQLGETPAVQVHTDQADIESGSLSFDEIFDRGRIIFQARFNDLDGQGRPGTTGGGAPRTADEPAFIRTSAPDSTSCAGCHAQPFSGGAGDFVANVFVLAQTLDPVTMSVDPNFSNERNTLGMNGSGAIEMLAREMSDELIAIREQTAQEAADSGKTVRHTLIAKGVNFGVIAVLPDGTVDPSEIEGVDWDLIVKPFHQKGAVVSVREFSNNAYNHHHGIQSVERFGLDTDPDGDGVKNELTVGDITATTIHQAALSAPGRCIPRGLETDIDKGEQLFSTIGCAECHVASFTLSTRLFTEPNPYNPVGNFGFKDDTTSTPYVYDMTTQGPAPHIEQGPNGTAIVRPFTDLKRHNLNDDQLDFFANEKVPQGKLNGFANAADFTIEPTARPTNQFLTRKLWDAGNTAPYGHRGDLTTLTDAIYYHGGEARDSRDAFYDLSADDRGRIVSFLKSMQILADGSDPVVLSETFEAPSPFTEVPTGDIRQCGSFGIIPLGLTLAGLAGMRRRRVR